jgi:2',3'-cyclic-nucleotide 2'-phosphodiesterase (5'-nucleotidase family)
MKILITLSFLVLCLSAEAKLLHIIHTNDLHSYFEGERNGKGGYAQLKAKIDELKKHSQERNIPTLILDGGDFSDGTSFYLVNQGADSLKALDYFGTEVAVVGNHDFLMGGKNLAHQIMKANVSTKVISANLAPTADMGLSKLVKPYADLEKDGLSIRVIGLTTAEPVFQYSMSPGHVKEPIMIGNTQAGFARHAGKDLVIALTHIGSYYDKLLVQNSTDINLVVGGHDHQKLKEALMVRNRNNDLVPIVQAGSHGAYLGSLIIDVKADRRVEVIEQKLIEINQSMPEDQQMANFVSKSAMDRDLMFQGRFDQPVGYSEIKLSGSCWGRNMAKLSAQATSADVGVHIPVFAGMSADPGVITLGNLVDNFPHISKHGDPGWRMGTVRVSGKALKIIIQSMASLKDYADVSFYGVTYRTFGPIFYNYKVKGSYVRNNRYYNLAMPAEIGNAVRLTLPQRVQAVLPPFKSTDKFYWPAMEAYVRVNSPITCL